MTPHPYSRFTDADRTLQARHLVSWSHKVLAAEAGIARQTVTNLSLAVWPVSLFRAFQFAEIQSDYRLVTLLAERAGAILSLPRAPLAHWSSLQLLSLLVLGFGRFLVLAEQVNEGKEPLMDEDMQTLVEEGEAIKHAIDALIEKARQQRKNAE